MNEEDRMDLSALDPSLDSERWARVMRATLDRVDAVLAARPRDPLTLIASWSRPLIRTAGLIVAILVPIEFALEKREARAEQVELLVQYSTRAAIEQWQPSGSDLSRALGQEPLP